MGSKISKGDDNSFFEEAKSRSDYYVSHTYVTRNNYTLTRKTPMEEGMAVQLALRAIPWIGKAEGIVYIITTRGRTIVDIPNVDI